MSDHRLHEFQCQRWPGNVYGPLILLVLAPILFPLVALVVLGHYLVRAYLYAAVWLIWCGRGSRILVVYSRSPHWQLHIENELLPQLPPRTIVLNWSDRKTWHRCSLGAQVFRHFLGYQEHTPSAMVFRPFRRVKLFRFHNAFHEAKHGNHAPLRQMEIEFLGLCSVL